MTELTISVRVGSYKIGDQKLHAGKRDAADSNRRPNACGLPPAAHDDDQIPRNDQRYGRAQTAHVLAQVKQRQPGSCRERNKRNANGAEGDWRGVCEQTNGGCIERLETESAENCGRNCDGSSEAGGAFEKRPKGEGDEKRLQRRVARQVADRILQDFKFPGMHRDPVQEDGPVNDPKDRECAEGSAIECRIER